MYRLKQRVVATPNFPDETVVTVAEWDRPPTPDELIALDVPTGTAERIIRTGSDGLKVRLLWLE